MSLSHPPGSVTRDPGKDLTERFVTLPDGRRIRTVAGGTRSGPLVVFEAGMSAPAAEWVHSQREIGKRTRTLSYDRSGYGGSDVDPADRTLERTADDLTALLDAIGETDPVVLVAHSWGGPIVKLFADRHPDRVAGLVLVDAVVAEYVSNKNARMAAASFRLTAALLRLGGKGLVKRATLPHVAPEISEADSDIMWRDYLCVQAMRTGVREATQMVAALPTIRRLQAAGTPDVPTICVQAGRVERGMSKIRPIFNQTVNDLMAAAPQGTAVVVEDAGHLIPQEHPAAVYDAISDVLEAIS